MPRSAARVLQLGRQRVPQQAGGKARGLDWLERHGYPVPKTWVIVPRDPEPSRKAIETALTGIVRLSQRYAVRSSADVEDGLERSYAGQFDSVLDVEGMDAAIEAVLFVARSAESEGVRSYAAVAQTGPGAVRMSVIVQEMVGSTMSGVAFSANPVTGFAETIIEAVPGSGEGLVQRGETPERWIRKAGAWISAPQPPLLPEKVAVRLAEDVADMAKRFGRPVDVEWVLGDERLAYVQMRPITGIGQLNYYSNKFSREVLPGIIHPLVWSVNIPLVNGAWIDLLEQLVGPTGLEPDQLAARLYCRAYFNMGALGTVFDMLGMPRESLELLSGLEKSDGRRPRPHVTLKVLSKFPRALAFAAQVPGYEQRTEREIAKIRASFEELRAAFDRDTSDTQALLAKLDSLRLMLEPLAYLNVLTPLLSEAFNHMLAHRLSRLGIAYESVDFANRDRNGEGRDPDIALHGLYEDDRDLPQELRDRARFAGVEAIRADSRAARFVGRFDRFIEVYGHFSDSGNDFSYVPWREDQSAVFHLIDAQSPRRSSAQRVTREDIARAARGWGTLWLFDRTSRLQVLREAVSSLYTLCYGFHRPLYLRLAEQLGISKWEPVNRAIFYLSADEIRRLAAGRLDALLARELVRERVAEEEQVRDVAVPDVVIGDTEAPLRGNSDGSLTGVATSPGRCTGRAVKISSISQAPDLQAGDIIVVPYSDVAWTPLLAQAGAIVAESGGFLSHTSIVAREYGIPAVVSVSGAMIAVPNGAMVEVDGFTGTVTVLGRADGMAQFHPESEVPG